MIFGKTMQFCMLLLPLAVSAVNLDSLYHYSAASPAQIRFAEENQYDDTGPGAKEPQFAYKTFNHLYDALLSYLDDPDTKLPESERARAIATFNNQDNYLEKNEVQNRINTVSRWKPRAVPFLLKSYKRNDKPEFRIPSSILLKVGKVSMWPPTKESKPYYYDNRNFEYRYKPHPEVEFSVDVHDKETGDVKSASELRDGSGTVHGYYSSWRQNRASQNYKPHRTRAY